MDLYFDRKNLRVLKYIYHAGTKGISWDTLVKKIRKSKSKDVNPENLLYVFYRNAYIIVRPNDSYSALFTMKTGSAEECRDKIYCCTSKASELIQHRCFDFWKWSIPIIISVIALTMSILSQFL